MEQIFLEEIHMPLFPQNFPTFIHILECALGYDLGLGVNPTVVSCHLGL